MEVSCEEATLAAAPREFGFRASAIASWYSGETITITLAATAKSRNATMATTYRTGDLEVCNGFRSSSSPKPTRTGAEHTDDHTATWQGRDRDEVHRTPWTATGSSESDS